MKNRIANPVHIKDVGTFVSEAYIADCGFCILTHDGGGIAWPFNGKSKNKYGIFREWASQRNKKLKEN